MTYQPSIIVVDYETEENGRASTEFYRPDFRVSSAAFSWYAEDGSIESLYLEGEHAVGNYLKRCVDCSLPVVAHNLQFEMGVTRSRFPDLAPKVRWHADTMRLVQVYDNGGDKFALEAPVTLDDQLDALENEDEDDEEVKGVNLAGLGLVKSCMRILRLPDHKEEAYTWLRANGVTKGREGSSLHLLPPDIMERYNVADTENTLKLYKFTTDYFAQIKYDWRKDHALYMSSVRQIVGAQARGIRVDIQKLSYYRAFVKKEIEQIGEQFCLEFADPIKRIERQRLLVQIRGRKTLRGRRGFIRRYRAGATTAVKEVRFNVGSNKQLASLFVDQLGIQPKFKTDKGAPSFKSSVLSQWGDGGSMLAKRRKRLLVLKQAENLLELASFDGRWHASLKAAGTATGRFSGGSHV